MKRSIRININYANKCKLDSIDNILTESGRIVNSYIDLLWNSRSRESFLCTACGKEIDADTNASINILHRGAYSPSLLTKTGLHDNNKII